MSVTAKWLSGLNSFRGKKQQDGPQPTLVQRTESDLAVLQQSRMERRFSNDDSAVLRVFVAPNDGGVCAPMMMEPNKRQGFDAFLVAATRTLMLHVPGTRAFLANGKEIDQMMDLVITDLIVVISTGDAFRARASNSAAEPGKTQHDLVMPPLDPGDSPRFKNLNTGDQFSLTDMEEGGVMSPSLEGRTGELDDDVGGAGAGSAQAENDAVAGLASAPAFSINQFRLNINPHLSSMTREGKVMAFRHTLQADRTRTVCRIIKDFDHADTRMMVVKVGEEVEIVGFKQKWLEAVKTDGTAGFIPPKVIKDGKSVAAMFEKRKKTGVGGTSFTYERSPVEVEISEDCKYLFLTKLTGTRSGGRTSRLLGGESSYRGGGGSGGESQRGGAASSLGISASGKKLKPAAEKPASHALLDKSPKTARGASGTTQVRIPLKLAKGVLFGVWTPALRRRDALQDPSYCCCSILLANDSLCLSFAEAGPCESLFMAMQEVIPRKKGEYKITPAALRWERARLRLIHQGMGSHMSAGKRLSVIMHDAAGEAEYGTQLSTPLPDMPEPAALTPGGTPHLHPLPSARLPSLPSAPCGPEGGSDSDSEGEI